MVSPEEYKTMLDITVTKLHQWSQDMLARKQSPLLKYVNLVDVRQKTVIQTYPNSGTTAYFVPYLFAEARQHEITTTVLIEPDEQVRDRVVKDKFSKMICVGPMIPYSSWSPTELHHRYLLVMTLADAKQYLSDSKIDPSNVLVIYDNLDEDKVISMNPLIFHYPHIVFLSHQFQQQFWLKQGFEILSGAIIENNRGNLLH